MVRQARQEVVSWVATHILPHEADVRAWLRRFVAIPADIDDVIQEAYCRIAALEEVTHIGSGRAYLFQTARNVALEHIRRARIVRIDSVMDIELLRIVDEAPSLDRVVAGRHQLQLVQELIEGLPEKFRRIFVLRRIHGMPQKEIAKLLGVSENTVEMNAARGLKMILAALERGAASTSSTSGIDHEQTRHRGRH
jgi:RNA polymerase sigma-70 factor (ECF subfamily)